MKLVILGTLFTGELLGLLAAEPRRPGSAEAVDLFIRQASRDLEVMDARFKKLVEQHIQLDRESRRVRREIDRLQEELDRHEALQKQAPRPHEKK